MWATFWKNGFRSIRQNKTYSFLNILGLAIGIACAGFIFLWVEDEFSYNRQNTHYHQLYLIKTTSDVSGGQHTHSSTPGLLGPALKAEVPGVVNSCRTTEGNTPMLFTAGNQQVYADGRYADSSIFSMFTLPFTQGSAKDAFTNLHAVVITESTAKKIFGAEAGQVIGKTVKLNNADNYTVTGVLKDIPRNSGLRFEWLIPFEVYAQKNSYVSVWGDFGTTTYVQLAQQADIPAINKQLYPYISTKCANTTSHFFLFAMKHWRLYNKFENGKMTGGRIEYVKLFTIIAWIILLIACINFMNLATARSEKRAREVGVRKVLGAARGSLIGQFTMEAVFLAAIATVLAMLIMVCTLPAFNLLVEKQLNLELNKPLHMAVLLGLTLLCGGVAGSYPSFYLSSFNPVFILKGIRAKAGGAVFLRKSLVVLQFSVSVTLIIATLIIYRQIQHVKSRNMGFNRNNLVQVPVQGTMERDFGVIRQDLLNTGMVENAALADHATIMDGNNTTDISWQGKDPESRTVISQRMITPEYLSTFGMQLVSGRDFNQGDWQNLYALLKGKDSSVLVNVIITQSMEKLLAVNSAVGSILTMPLESKDHPLQLRVVGVMKDYVYGDMYKGSAPVIFYCLGGESRYMYVRTKTGAPVEKTLASITAVMKKNNPDFPFDYVFVDDQFNNEFTSEMLISKLSRVFASLAIIISCLGLFGLASYTAERRTREIGIRKVLGASSAGIAFLLSGEFMKLVIVSCLIAFPLAAWTMHSWLQEFAYRISLSGWVFVAAGVAAVVIAFATISLQAIKAAIANPVKNLRRE